MNIDSNMTNKWLKDDLKWLKDDSKCLVFTYLLDQQQMKKWRWKIDSNMTNEWLKVDSKMTQRWLKNDSKMTKKWLKDDSRMIKDESMMTQSSEMTLLSQKCNSTDQIPQFSSL